MDILQPAPGASKMGYLLPAIKITCFVIKWGAYLSTLAAGVWMLHGMVNQNTGQQGAEAS
jgi:hypothetical protein